MIRQSQSMTIAKQAREIADLKAMLANERKKVQEIIDGKAALDAALDEVENQVRTKCAELEKENSALKTLLSREREQHEIDNKETKTSSSLRAALEDRIKKLESEVNLYREENYQLKLNKEGAKPEGKAEDKPKICGSFHMSGTDIDPIDIKFTDKDISQKFLSLFNKSYEDTFKELKAEFEKGFKSIFED